VIASTGAASWIRIVAARLSRFRNMGLAARLSALLLVGALIALMSCGNGSSTSHGRNSGSVPAVASRSESAQIVSAAPVKGRMQDLVVRSPAVRGDVHVRLLLPSRYNTDRSSRWPVLYLLHGCCDTYLSWTRSTDVEKLTRTLNALIVMPDGGKVGFYSDWREGPGWETFHTGELPALLAARYHTSERAVIAGVSMGGLGALVYAARHPGMFTVAASFSGIVHTRLSDAESQGYLSLVASQGGEPQLLWGPTTDARAWRAHNPYDLAPLLKGVRLFVSAGNGQPGPLDPSRSNTDSIESSIGAENVAFAGRLRTLRLDATIDLYGPGTHNWVYWQRELHRAWPLITRGLGLA
jgi:diacylglycerol O-acyltransferase/trehalose O-mycolyltransferase